MKTIPIRGITAGFIGLFTTATLGIAQQAQAIMVKSDSQVNFRDVSLTLNNGNVVPLFFNTIQGNAFVTLDGQTDAPGGFSEGPFMCPKNLTNTVGASVTNGTANGGATADCSDQMLLQASNFANTMLTGNLGQANSAGLYTFASQDFDVVSGDFLDLKGFVKAQLLAEVKDFVPGPGESATANADYVLTYNVFLNNSLVFSGPLLSDSVSVINQNGIDTDSVPEIALDDLPFPVDYTFTDGGTARVQFSGREQASSSVRQTVPEPSALISLASLGIVALVSRKKNNNAHN
jgi:hypothetical protein